MWSCNWVVEKFRITLKPISRGENVKNLQKIPFLALSLTLKPQLSSISLKIGADVEHRVIYVNALAKFCNYLLYFFQGVRYAKKGQNLFLTTLMTPLSQVAML